MRRSLSSFPGPLKPTQITTANECEQLVCFGNLAFDYYFTFWVSVTVHKSKRVFYRWTNLNRHLHRHFSSVGHQVNVMTWRRRFFFFFFLWAVCLRLRWRVGWKWRRPHFLSSGQMEFLQTKFSSNCTLTWFYLWLWVFSTSFLSTSRIMCSVL